jgi:MscS family membrane protein
MIYADRPFKIGDYVSTTEIEGTVEDIGFRSTRIRTLDTSLIAVPNGKLVDMTINNLGARQRRRYRTFVDIPYHTPPDLIEIFLQGLIQITLNHPNTAKDVYYIRLNSLEGSSLRILFIIYFLTNDYAEDIKYREQVILSIIRLAEKLGVQLAFPSTSVYGNPAREKRQFAQLCAFYAYGKRKFAGFSGRLQVALSYARARTNALLIRYARKSRKHEKRRKYRK